MQILSLFVEARQLREMHNQNNKVSDRIPVSAADYIADIEVYTGYKINLHTLNAVHKQAKGRIHRYDDELRAEVFIAPLKADENDEHGITYCEQRHISLKESSHVVLDTAECYTTNLENLADELIFSNQVAQAITDLSEEFQSEFLAEILSLELLFPWELRNSCRERIENKETTYYEVANRFKIPEQLVRAVLHEKIHRSLTILHKAVDAVEEAMEKK